MQVYLQYLSTPDTLYMYTPESEDNFGAKKFYCMALQSTFVELHKL